MVSVAGWGGELKDNYDSQVGRLGRCLEGRVRAEAASGQKGRDVMGDRGGRVGRMMAPFLRWPRHDGQGGRGRACVGLAV